MTDPSDVPHLDAVLSPEGWPYASATAVDAADPGRFHALFGRDSLITSLQLLPVRSDLAVATVRALAARQGARHDPVTDEEPGKILHEYWERAPVWLRESGWPLRADGAMLYYGSADSTSWFLVLLAAMRQQAAAGRVPAAVGAVVDEMGDAVAGAAGWLLGALRAGGGFVRYGPRTAPGGLAQQGWRDATEHSDEGNGIVHHDGTSPAAPLADVDTQSVALVALRALAVLDPALVPAGAVEELAGRIATTFGPDVMAVQPDGVVVSGAGSQLGWLLWSGALAGDRAAEVVARISAPDVLTDSGLRTLASTAGAYVPHGYHRGSVWPFDSWLGWSGLRAAADAGSAGAAAVPAAGAAADRVRTGVLAAVERLGHAPELYAVGPAGPERVGTANQVQAWTIGARWALEHRWAAPSFTP